MSDTNKQHISALMDNALGADESRFVLRRMHHEPDLVQIWSRYHLMRDCLQGHPAVLVSTSFSDRVMGHLQENASAAVRQRNRSGRWLQLGAGGAIAASVAVAALMLTQVPPGVPADTTSTSMPESAAPTVADIAVPAPTAAPQDFSLLLNQSRSPWLYVQPAAATRQQNLGYLGAPTFQARQPLWLHRGEPGQAGTPAPRAPTYVLRAAGQAVAGEHAEAVGNR